MSPAQQAVHYARALFEVARENNELEPVREDLQRLSFILAQVEGALAFCRHDPVQRSAELEERFCRTALKPYLGKRLYGCILVLAGNRRLAIMPHLEEAFARIASAAAGITPVHLESCHEPDADTLANITAAMTVRCGGPIVLHRTLEPSLRGGFRLLWNNRIIDASLSGRIAALRTTLTSARGAYHDQ